MRVEVVELLGRLAEASFAQPKERTVFLINNYDQIVTIFRSRTVGGEARCRALATWREGRAILGGKRGCPLFCEGFWEGSVATRES